MFLRSLIGTLLVALLLDFVQADYVRACYFTNWSKYRQGRANYNVTRDYIPGLCTHILFAFGSMTSDFQATNFDPSDVATSWAGIGQYAQVNELKRVDGKLKTLLSFGGASFSQSLFQQMASSPVNRHTFIQSAIQFVRLNGFDGIDMDWEFPSLTDKTNYAAFLTELRSAVTVESQTSGRPRLLVTAAVAAGDQNMVGYDMSAMSRALDYIFLMSYDFWGAWSDILGMNAPLYPLNTQSSPINQFNVDWAAKAWVANGIEKNQLVIGMPAYGRGWTLASSSRTQPGDGGNSPSPAQPFTQESGIGAYFEICSLFSSRNAQRIYQNQQEVPYLIVNGQWWSYDDNQSFYAKLNYIKSNGYGGAMVWALDQDDFNGQCPNSNGIKYPLISQIGQVLGNSSPLPQSSTNQPLPLPVTTKKSSTQSPPPPPTKPLPTQAPNPNDFSCLGKSDGFYADPSNCSSYIWCIHGSNTRFSCPPGLLFDQSNLLCNYPNLVKC